MATLVRYGRSHAKCLLSTAGTPSLSVLLHQEFAFVGPQPFSYHRLHHRAPQRCFGTSNVTKSTSTTKKEGEITEHRVQRVVPFTCEQLFDVVADVDNYKSFLPYCTQSAVLRRVPPNFMLAQLIVGFNSLLKEKYTSRVRLDRPRSITIAALDSKIFTRLESTWSFQPTWEDKEGGSGDGTAGGRGEDTRKGDGCTHVDFRIRFQVSNSLAQKAINMVFEDLVERQIHAFEDRCHAVYGSGAGKGGREDGEEMQTRA